MKGHAMKQREGKLINIRNIKTREIKIGTVKHLEGKGE